MAISRFQLVPDSAAAGLALYLPWLEVIAGSALLATRFRAGAVAILMVLMLAFSAALASAWWHGLDISCGCFGGSGATSYPVAFLRNAALGGALAAIAWAEWWRRQVAPDFIPAGSKGPARESA